MRWGGSWARRRAGGRGQVAEGAERNGLACGRGCAGGGGGGGHAGAGASAWRRGIRREGRDEVADRHGAGGGGGGGRARSVPTSASSACLAKGRGEAPSRDGDGGAGGRCTLGGSGGAAARRRLGAGRVFALAHYLAVSASAYTGRTVASGRECAGPRARARPQRRHAGPV